METVYNTKLDDLSLKNRGKVRDIYDLGEYLLFVATDRISAFDVVMNDAIPEKGKILSNISAFWFNKTNLIIPNHLVTSKVDEFPEEARKYADQLESRSMLVKKCEPLPVEFIVRGYVAGSGWKEYQSDGTICGIPLPDGLQEFERLPEPIFTPSTKADVGHDENIDFDKAAELIGKETAEKLSNISIDLYKFGRDFLNARDLILADTKFEFGRLENGEIILIDETLTPDSSRFWLKENYAPGKKQVQFDKQVLRDYLESTDWDKTPPPPKLPENVIQDIIESYKEAYRRITSK